MIPQGYYVFYQVEGEPSPRIFKTIAEGPEQAMTLFERHYMWRREQPPKIVRVLNFRQYYREFHEGEV